MAAQILGSGAAHRQLLAKGRHAARKEEASEQAAAPRYLLSHPGASEEEAAAVLPPPPPPHPGEEGRWERLPLGSPRPRQVSGWQPFEMKYKDGTWGVCLPTRSSLGIRGEGEPGTSSFYR